MLSAAAGQLVELGPAGESVGQDYGAGVEVAHGRQQLLPAVREAGPEVVVLADGFSCRTQLDQLAGRRGQHLAELLAARLP